MKQTVDFPTTPIKQLSFLKARGVRFNMMCEEDTLLYLQTHPNLKRLYSYTQNFNTIHGGKRDGQFDHLDMQHLVTLHEMDEMLSKTFFYMLNTIEMHIRDEILKKVYDNHIDCYAIVRDFVSSKYALKGQKDEFYKDIDNARKNEYTKYYLEGVEGYDIPIEIFVNVVMFGRLIAMYKYCGEIIGDEKMIKDIYLLLSCKSLRNAVAHGNSVINDLKVNKNADKIAIIIKRLIGEIDGINVSLYKSRLKNKRLIDMITTLYFYKNHIKPNAKEIFLIQEIKVYIKSKIHLFFGIEMIRNSLDLVAVLLDNWFDMQYFGNGN